MKINEVVTLHPSVKAKSEYEMLLLAGDEKQDEIIAYIMNDNNPEARRIEMLRHLDIQLGAPEPTVDAESLEHFMHDQGEPNISAEEEEEYKKDMKIPPYHLSVVDETEDEIPTGEYEICQRCGGEGCIECEEGLKDITGMHKVLDLDDFPKGE